MFLVSENDDLKTSVVDQSNELTTQFEQLYVTDLKNDLVEQSKELEDHRSENVRLQMIVDRLKLENSEMKKVLLCYRRQLAQNEATK